MRKRREGTIEERVTKIETEIPHIYRELKEIKKHVTNDLPHDIAALQTSLDKLVRRHGDMDAVSRFLSVCLKGLTLVFGLLWTGKQVWGAFVKH